MLNKLYVIGVRQCEVVERCFLHDEGVYVYPMNRGDLDVLSGQEPKLKIKTNGFEVFEHKYKCPTWKN